MFDSNPSDPKSIPSEEAFRFLLGTDYVLDKCISAPYREDKRPSFILRKNSLGEVRFNDYATGQWGDWLDLYKLMYGGNYHSALRMFKGSITPISVKNRVEKVDKQKSRKKLPDIDVKFIPWSENLLDYWRQFNISYFTLLHYNVKPISMYRLEGYDPRYIIGYSYEFPNNERKILIPNAYKGGKWFTNSLSIQGMEQLEASGDILIITKSLKDVMVLYELGYSSIAPQAESVLIEPEWISYFKANYKRVVLLFDNDTPGEIASLKYKEAYPFMEIIFIDKDYGKDISDVSKNHGLDMALNIMKSLLK